MVAQHSIVEADLGTHLRAGYIQSRMEDGEAGSGTVVGIPGEVSRKVEAHSWDGNLRVAGERHGEEAQGQPARCLANIRLGVVVVAASHMKSLCLIVYMLGNCSMMRHSPGDQSHAGSCLHVLCRRGLTPRS